MGKPKTLPRKSASESYLPKLRMNVLRTIFKVTTQTTTANQKMFFSLILVSLIKEIKKERKKMK